MRRNSTIPKKLAAFAVVVATLSLIVVVTGARSAAPSTATINGPATVLDGYTCTWTASTDIADPTYEWQGPGSVVIGTGPSVSYAYDHANGAHQILKLSVHNAAGDGAVDYLLVGVYLDGAGTPDCP